MRSSASDLRSNTGCGTSQACQILVRIYRSRCVALHRPDSSRTPSGVRRNFQPMAAPLPLGRRSFATRSFPPLIYAAGFGQRCGGRAKRPGVLHAVPLPVSSSWLSRWPPCSSADHQMPGASGLNRLRHGPNSGTRLARRSRCKRPQQTAAKPRLQ